MSAHGRFGWMTGLAAGVLVLATAAVGVAYAHQQAGPGGGPMRQRGMMPGAMMRLDPMGLVRLGLGRLDLTTEQRQQVRTIVSGHKTEFQALGDRAVPARRALMDAIVSGDEAAIRQRSADLAAVQADGALLATRVRAEIFKILTPEQQQKARALREQQQQRTAGRRAGRGIWR